MLFDPISVRVLGSLIEKEITTPDLYPLSLNSLVNACNQRSSRDPVLELSEGEVREALRALEEHGLVTVLQDARVPKFEHRARTVFNLRRDETAIMCLLMLRGPQTPGELRARSERLYAFDEIASVQATLERLAARASQEGEASEEASTGPLVVLLPRQPGARESRYMHLLCGTPQEAGSGPPLPAENTAQTDRIARLEADVARMAETLTALEARIRSLETNR
jgi:uncharacterized protein YceH (UPF0502 family)